LSVDPAHSLADILELGGPVPLPPRSQLGGPLRLTPKPPSSRSGDTTVTVAGTSIANPVRVDGIDVVELDAQAAFAQRRARYRDAVDELFDGLRGGSASTRPSIAPWSRTSSISRHRDSTRSSASSA